MLSFNQQVSSILLMRFWVKALQAGQRMPDNTTADNSRDSLLRHEALRYVWRQGEHKNCGAASQAL